MIGKLNRHLNKTLARESLRMIAAAGVLSLAVIVALATWKMQ